MRKKQFRLGAVILAGLAIYFLVLSALIVRSANTSGGNRFGSTVRKSSRIQKDFRGKQPAGLPSRNASHHHRSNSHLVSTSNQGAIPCPPSLKLCGADVLEENGDGSPYRGTQGPDGSFIASGKIHPFANQDRLYPSSFGFNAFGGEASGQSTSENGNSSPPHNSGDTKTSPTSSAAGNTTPGSVEADPGSSSFPSDPNFVAPPDIWKFSPSAPPGSGDPIVSAGPASFDTPAPSDVSGPPYPLPEPSTIWLLLASLGAVVTVIRAPRQSG